jgi:hypothetical protein
MNATRTYLGALALLLLAASATALADDWAPVAKDQGVELAYQAVGNQVRLRLTNSGREPMTVAWKLRVQLASGTSVDNLGELNLAAGETETIASAPYRDAGQPVEVKNVTGTIAAKKKTAP